MILPNTNFYPTINETFVTTLTASIAANATTVPLATGAPYADGDVVVLTVDAGTVKQATFTGTKSGNSVINATWTEGNTGVGHDGGASVQDYDSATHVALLAKGLRQHSNQDGSLKTASVQSAIGTGGIGNINIGGGSVDYSKLLNTIFSSQVQTYTPLVGSINGGTYNSATGFYLNLGGVKIAWGTVGVATLAQTGRVGDVQLPPGFFSSVQIFIPAIKAVGNAPYQTVSGNDLTTTAFNYYWDNSFNGVASHVMSFLVIGA